MNDKLSLPTYYVKEGLVRADAMSIYSQALKRMQIDTAHKKYSGKGIIIGIVDTGSRNVKDLPTLLPSEMLYATGFTDGIDRNNHGTMCRGLISMKLNEDGFVGSGYGAKALSGKALGIEGDGTIDTLIEMGDRLVRKGCKILSMSLGSRHPSTALLNAIKRWHAAGVIIICAAGNDKGGSLNFPAAYKDYVISVGAVDWQEKRADFSNVNADFMAYGVSIPTTSITGAIVGFTGTSAAVPIVSGVVALYLEMGYNLYDRLLTLNEVKKLLIAYAKDLGVKGKDNDTGYGLIQAVIPSKSQCDIILGLDEVLCQINQRAENIEYAFDKLTGWRKRWVSALLGIV